MFGHDMRCLESQALQEEFCTYFFLYQFSIYAVCVTGLADVDARMHGSVLHEQPVCSRPPDSKRYPVIYNVLS